MANKLTRIGYTQIIPANPGRPPTPAYTVTTVVPATSPIPTTGGNVSTGGAGSTSTGGSWVLMPPADNGGISYGGGYVWVPSGGIVPNTGIQPS